MSEDGQVQDNPVVKKVDVKENEVVLNEEDIITLIEDTEINTIKSIQRSEEFSGPLPHPEHMKQYQEIDPSLPTRIVDMAESNLNHKKTIEKITVIGGLAMGFLGWATPTCIASYVLYHAVSFIKEGKSIEALIALIAALATLGGAFYMKKEKKEK
jgi:hypothetical protein